MKNFFDCKDEKITEKAFSQSLLISAFSILLCLVALCSMTYAWFTSETTSTGNTLVSGSFDLVITVTKDNTDYHVTADANNDGVWNCNLTDAGTYTVTLKFKEGSSVKGHCVVKVGDGDFKHTAAITNTDPTMTFFITVTEKTPVVFEPIWGIVVDPDIENGDAYPVPAAANKENNAEPETTA